MTRNGSRRTRLPLLLVFAAILLVAALATWLTRTGNSGSETVGSTSSETSAAHITTTSTVLEETSAALQTTISPVVRQALFDEACSLVLDRLSDENGRFAVFYQNMATGDIWRYQETEPFVAASSIKIGINTYLYTKIASGEISSAEMLAYDSRLYPTGDYESGTGSIQYEPNGTQFSVRDTSGLSIRISDNCATNMIIRRLGGIDAILPYFKSVSAEVGYRTKVSYTNYAGQPQSGRHRTSAVDLGLQAVNLYTLWQETPQDYQPLIDDLTQTEFDFGIQKGIPDDVLVAHKIGTNGAYSAENDVGIVFAEEPFVLCVMTEMASQAAAHQVQADIAAIFYQLVVDVTDESPAP